MNQDTTSPPTPSSALRIWEMFSPLLSVGTCVSPRSTAILAYRRPEVCWRRHRALSVQDCSGDGNPERMVIQVPQPRPLQALPSPIPVVHSPAYLYEMRSVELGGQTRPGVSPPNSGARKGPSSKGKFTGSALEWALAR